MTPSETALDRVHSLYLLQAKFITSLDGDVRDAVRREELLQDIRTFQRLLNQADWRYMGGQDVMDSLKGLHDEIKAKLKGATPRKVVFKQKKPMKKRK